jgi:hypothetical protein
MRNKILNYTEADIKFGIYNLFNNTLDAISSEIMILSYQIKLKPMKKKKQLAYM